MSDVLCPHCGHPHPPEVVYCPTTGRQVRAPSPGLPMPDGSQPPAAAAPPAPPPPEPAPAAAEPSPAAGAPGEAPSSSAVEKGVADIFKEAYELCRQQGRMLLTTCAVLFVPAAVVSSCARALVSSPTDGPPGVISGAAGVTAFYLYGLVMPLTTGALTIAVADRVLGGTAGWREAWRLLFRRLGLLLSAVIPAAVLIGIGAAFAVIPGMIFGLLFAFVAPVVLLEGLRGRAALWRSVKLVGSDWLRVVIVIIALGVLSWLARMIAAIFINVAAVFARSLFGDLLTLAFLLVPLVGLALLYLDIRRKREGFTSEQLRAELDALKSA